MWRGEEQKLSTGEEHAEPFFLFCLAFSWKAPPTLKYFTCERKQAMHKHYQEHTPSPGKSGFIFELFLVLSGQSLLSVRGLHGYSCYGAIQQPPMEADKAA